MEQVIIAFRPPCGKADETSSSLMRSDILSPSTFKRNLSEPTLRLQRLYTTATQGRSGFFEYLRRSMEYFNRRLILLRTDDRFSIGIFIRGQVPWDEEAQINENVAVVALTPTAQQSMSLCESLVRRQSYVLTHIPPPDRHTVHGYRLHCSDGLFQLYNKGIHDTWIFINRPPYESFNELQASIALQKISSVTQKVALVSQHLNHANQLYSISEGLIRPQ